MLAMEKHRVNDDHTDFPLGGQGVNIPLQSPNQREKFWLDLRRGSIDLRKVTMQNRGRQVVVLARLDLRGAPHRNPDGEELPTPHLHVYREGYGSKWAIPVPADQFANLDDIWQTLQDFMAYCSISHPPLIQRGLFT